MASPRVDGTARAETRKGLTLLAPPLLYALLLLAAPLGMVVVYSFLTDGYLVVEWTFTLENYIEAWTSPIYQTVMLRSLWVSFLVTLATVVLAYPVAYYVSFHVEPSKKSLWLFLITIPFWTSYVIRVFLWRVILGTDGVLNTGLMGLGIINEPMTFLLYNINAVIITLAHAYAPFAILPIFVVLERIDRSLLEAGQDLGESRFTTWVRVTLPLSVPGICAAVLIVFIPTIGDFVTPQLVGGPNGLLIANVIQVQYMRIGNFPLGSAIAISAMIIVSICALFFLWLNRRYLRVGR
jgi:spermidine/putrescine transport system permease protein